MLQIKTKRAMKDFDGVRIPVGTVCNVTKEYPDSVDLCVTIKGKKVIFWMPLTWVTEN